MSMIELALNYAATGIAVFPCREEDKEDYGSDGRLRTYKEKTPIPSNGFMSATTTERIVRRRWEDDPKSVIGAATGSPSGFWVLDIDVPSDAHRADGRVWLRDMEALNGPLPATKISQTANGGLHYFFLHVEGIRNGAGIGAGVDVRGDGGFVIMPGSVMADGRFYEWRDDESPIADAPQWLIDLVITKEYEGPVTGAVGAKYEPSPENLPYVTRAVESEVAALASVTQGGRGHAANRHSFNLGTLVGGGSLARSEAEAALYSACVTNGLVGVDGEREVMNKIRRGLDAGARKPRDAPAPEQRSNTRVRDIDKMLANARRRAEEEEEAERIAAEREASGDDEGDDSDNSHYEDDQSHYEEDYPQSEPEEEKDNIRATPLTEDDLDGIPLRDFIWGQHLVRKFVSVTVSPGGVGKTSLLLCEAMSMASGIDFLQVPVKKPLRVWVFNAEDPRDELLRRVKAARDFYDLYASDYAGRIFLDSGRDQDLIIAHEDRKTGLMINVPIVDAVVSQIIKNRIDVVIVDPFVSTHQVNENDNGAIDAVAKTWAKIADYTNCAIDIVHHLKKVSDRDATVEDARGAVSLIGAARSVRVLNRMNEEQAKEAGISEEDRMGYFSITNGKNNLAPTSSKMTWRRLVGQGIGNGYGDDGLEEQDFAPVVVPFNFPSFLDRAEHMTGDMLDRLKSAFKGTGLPETSPKKGEDSVFNAVEFVLGLTANEDVSRVRATIARLVKSGVMVPKVEADGIEGRNVKLFYMN